MQVSPNPPYITIRVVFKDGPEIIVDGLIDTGFDGFLSFPVINLAATVKPVGNVVWTMADGARIPTQVYAATAEVVGIEGSYFGDVAILGREILIGRRFTNRYRVTFDHGREVIVEP